MRSLQSRDFLWVINHTSKFRTYLAFFNACTYAVNLLFYVVILNFADRATEDIYNGVDSKVARRIPRSVWRVAVRKLDMLNAASDLRDLRVPPANKLEALKKDLAGHHAIRINNQYRLLFKWIDGNAKDVRITDYH